MTFLFWNLHRANVAHHVAALATEHELDVIALAECADSVVELLETLNPRRRRAAWIYSPSFLPTKVELFVRGDPRFVVPLFDTSRVSIREIRFPASAPFLLALLHLSSRMYYTEEDKSAEAREVSGLIQTVERQVGYRRTIAVGDFNMNPYSPGLVTANGFNAVMTRDIAVTNHRKVGGTVFPYFFNPMWKIFGDGEHYAPGTYYYRPSGYASVHWHIFDQVLVRPRLMHRFRTQDLHIVRNSAKGSLVDSKRRPATSDHLPIIFKLSK